MRIDRLDLSSRFVKQLTRLSVRKQDRVREALRLAINDPGDPRLRVHALAGQFQGTYSISAGGDLRIHFRLIESDGQSIASLQSVGTHSQLYG
jgi:mRNA-degrading endonuclease YafQ of YafQ-DinJ toxin-antitoxin module